MKLPDQVCARTVEQGITTPLLAKTPCRCQMGFFFAFLASSQAILSESLGDLPDLSLTSTAKFHFLATFHTVGTTS